MVKARPQTRVPITLRAVLQRVNRALAKEGRQLKPGRGARQKEQLGDYYVLDVERGVVVDHHTNLEALARKLGVVAEWEELS